MQIIDKNTRILVVDDIESVLSHARSILGGMGYQNIICAGDGQKALEALEGGLRQGEGIGLVLCDWNMPGMDGIELLQRVQKFPSLKKVPFIMVTAEINTRNIVDAIAAGASDYIVKPLTAEAFARKVRDLNARLAKRAA